MSMIQYQRNGSVIVTNEIGDVIVVPKGTQTEQDAAISIHIGPQAPPDLTLDEKVDKLAALLVKKNIATDAEMKDATAIDTAAIVIAVDIKSG